jgi:hypothetical protein
MKGQEPGVERREREAASPPISDSGSRPSTLDSRLSFDQQQLLLALLLKGASPLGACQQLGLSIADYLRTRRDDEAFRQQTDLVYQLLAQNVVAALYKAAMQGNVTAQSCWLRSNPPPGWNPEPPETDQPRTFDHFFDQLSDHELLELARAMGVNLSPEIERTLFGQSGPQIPPGLSP